MADDIKAIEEEIAKTKYNKATQYHIGKLKAKIARLMEKQETEKSRSGMKGKAYAVKKTGDATVLMVGFPSVGKSTLLNSITNADSKTAEYDFTTLDVIPGILEYNSAKIQVLDLPGIVEGASFGRGRGREILSVVRSADLVLILIDSLPQLDVIRRELYNSYFRLDSKPPNVMIARTHGGGVRVSATKKLRHIDRKMVQIVFNENGIHNAEVLIREDITLERMIDCLYKNRAYVPSIVVFNKIDKLTGEQVDEIRSIPNCIPISSLKKENLESLKQAIWEKLGLIRVYLKRIGKEPDLKVPLIVRRGSSVADVAAKIHRDFSKRLEHARVWGSSKFPGQKVGVTYVVRDRDIVELH